MVRSEGSRAGAKLLTEQQFDEWVVPADMISR